MTKKTLYVDKARTPFLVGIIRDITDRKQIEDQLMRKSAILGAAAEISIDGILVLDKNRKNILVNRRFQEMWGIPTNVLEGGDEMGMIRYLLNQVKEPARFIQNMESLEKNPNEKVRDEIEFKDGRVLDRYSSAFYSPQGDYEGRIWYFRDITDYKKIEERLIRDGAREKALLRLAQMHDLAADDISKYAMEAAISLTSSRIGYMALMSEDESFMTMNYWSKTVMAQCEMVDRPLVFTIRDLGLLGEPIRQRRPVMINDYSAIDPARKALPKGHIGLSRHLGLPIFDGQKIVALAGVGNKPTEYTESDVTQLTLMMEGMMNLIHRKRMEEELQKAKEGLEVKVGERTSELTSANQELKVLAEELKRASNAKSEFLANMSHELRTPLNSVIGFSEVLSDETFGRLNEKQKKYMQYVLASGRHLLSLINDVLDLSKVEAGKMELVLSRVSMKLLLEESVEFVRETAYKKEIEISISVEEGIGEILCDERKVKQVVFNLLSNAVKFTPQAGKVGVRAGRIQDGFLEVEVWDNGIGIAPEDQAKIFETFTRLQNSRTLSTEGTGLGLALSKKIVELHGGTIRLVSEGLNQGTTVRFTLPMGQHG